MSATILDACCLINLYATDVFREVLGGIGGSWYVAQPALDEAMFLREISCAGEEQRRRIDLSEELSAGVMCVIDAKSGAELATFVALARQLDDAEALALAIAKHRGWCLATDDRKAQGIAERIDVNVVSTPELMKAWAEGVGVGSAEISAALSKIELRACFTPGADSAEYLWWKTHVQFS